MKRCQTKQGNLRQSLIPDSSEEGFCGYSMATVSSLLRERDKLSFDNLSAYMRERGLLYRYDVERDERDINTVLAKIWIRRRDSKEMIEIRV